MANFSDLYILNYFFQVIYHGFPISMELWVYRITHLFYMTNKHFTNTS